MSNFPARAAVRARWSWGRSVVAPDAWSMYLLVSSQPSWLVMNARSLVSCASRENGWFFSSVEMRR
ncbi:hypothetical protein [Frankia sp. KB5]|uniref:hypothetical protein n=1 Tax=Frankia sp. KB5 TaxID=683318 RepID=UPI001F52F853|nr:hypothetical protein [Frankia sp. KB5]